MKPKALLSILISGLVIQMACGGKQEGPASASAKAVPVSVVAAGHATIPDVVEAPGTIQPRHRIVLSSQINGFVREMRVRVGDSVKQDQVLALLDARDAESQKAATQAAIDEAQAALSEARRAHRAEVEMQSAAKASAELANQTFSRYQKLYESRSVSPQEIDEVRARRDAAMAELSSRESMVAAAEDRIRQGEARISQAKAQLNRADVMISWTQIKAPSAGNIVERTAEAGTAIFPGTPLMMIESTARPQVLADLPTEHANRLRVGMEVRLRTAEAGGAIEGRVTEIVPLSNPATHSIQFKVDLPSTVSLPNGQFVRVEVPVGTRDALLVPRQAIRETGQLTGLFVVDGSSKARFRLVKLTPYDADKSEVLSGIEPGERIIAGLNDQIIDGVPVEIRP
jgi:multidrug efflux pump subunit AcrA (membrane-fusion protein)